MSFPGCQISKCFWSAYTQQVTRLSSEGSAHVGVLAVNGEKELLYTSLDMNLQDSLDLEGQLQDNAFSTADYQEGVNAFMQKRTPRYRGK